MTQRKSKRLNKKQIIADERNSFHQHLDAEIVGVRKKLLEAKNLELGKLHELKTIKENKLQLTGALHAFEALLETLKDK